MQIHPNSVLAKRKAPIVVFHEKMENQKGIVYIKGCSEVLPEQIVRMAANYCKFVRVKTEAARFDQESGFVLGLYKVSYFKTATPLGEHWERIKDDNETMLRCITHALLDGQIFECFKKLSNKWLSPPAGEYLM